jgi:hypothetical protein
MGTKSVRQMHLRRASATATIRWLHHRGWAWQEVDRLSPCAPADGQRSAAGLEVGGRRGHGQAPDVPGVTCDYTASPVSSQPEESFLG